MVLTALVAGLPAVVVAVALLMTQEHAPKVRWTLTALVVTAWVVGIAALHARVTRSLHVVSALLSALREEDFSLRGRVVAGRDDDALSAVMREINGLADTLREQRLGAFEADALLRSVMEEIDVAVLAFDAHGSLRLVNRAAERLLGAGMLLGRDAASLGLADCLNGEAPRTLLGLFPGEAGPWELRRSRFRQRGLPHTLVVLTDLRRALREEERQAWQRLVRVLGHEINNSLAPIQSIADNLRLQLQQSGERAPDLDEDLASGLEVITRRSAALGRFLTAYARMARLPPPRLGPVEVAAWVRRVTLLERRVILNVVAGPDAVVLADGDQVDQLLINLVGNAADAALVNGGGVTVTWRVAAGQLELEVIDEGQGLADTANLFVPFFTTKPGGNGIGLVLSRQIAEAHGGSLTLTNRKDRSGCVARVRLAVTHASVDSLGEPVRGGGLVDPGEGVEAAHVVGEGGR